MDENLIRSIFKQNDVKIVQDDAWKVQKVWVIKHAALERLAAALGIVWGEPKIVIATDEHFAVLVSATRPDKRATEWSIGEARVVRMVDTGKKNQWGKPIYEPSDSGIGNYQVSPRQAAYPAAMAEKRGKDRVILKLAGLHGAYSEEEADDFKRAAQQSRQPDRPRQADQRQGDRLLPAPDRRDDRNQGDRRYDDRRQLATRTDRR